MHQTEARLTAAQTSSNSSKDQPDIRTASAKFATTRFGFLAHADVPHDGRRAEKVAFRAAASRRDRSPRSRSTQRGESRRQRYHMYAGMTPKRRTATVSFWQTVCGVPGIRGKGISAMLSKIHPFKGLPVSH